jgi:O-acetyl-ADP-ribose deacetylase (regulator of RNase III)
MPIEKQLDFLLKELSPMTTFPSSVDEKWRLFRSIVNRLPPQKFSDELLLVQGQLLKSLIEEKGITDIANLQPIKENIYLWRGDIVTLKVDAIVNAANSQMLGCFVPCHACIDNAIHTFAGVQLRQECAEIMEKQGYEEPTGAAKITKAYNLPSKYILHTVGPIIWGKETTVEDRQLLASSYLSCLYLAVQNGIESIAFCCISTGEFHFPNKEAAKIAIQTVSDFLKEKNRNNLKIVFNVFKEEDENIYKQLLG